MREYYPREKLIVAVKRGDIPAMFGWHEVCEVLNCSERNAHKILADLTKLGLLIKCGGRKRRNNHEYTLYELYDPIDNLIARVLQVCSDVELIGEVARRYSVDRESADVEQE